MVVGEPWMCSSGGRLNFSVDHQENEEPVDRRLQVGEGDETCSPAPCGVWCLEGGIHPMRQGSIRRLLH